MAVRRTGPALRALNIFGYVVSFVLLLVFGVGVLMLALPMLAAIAVTLVILAGLALLAFRWSKKRNAAKLGASSRRRR